MKPTRPCSSPSTYPTPPAYRMVTSPPVLSVMCCRPPSGLASSEKVTLPLERVVLIVMCTARPAFSAASDAATTAVADPGEGAVAAGEAAGEAGFEPADAEPAAPGLAGAAGAGTVFVPLQPASSASPARVASADAGRDRFTFLC